MDFSKNNTALLDTVKPSLIEFFNSYTSAYTSPDAGKFTNVTDNYKSQVGEYLNLEKEANDSYTGTFSDLTAYPSSLSIEKDYSTDNSNSYIVYVAVSCTGSVHRTSDTPDSDLYYSIHLKYNESQKKWLIDSFSSTYNDYKSDTKGVALK